MQDEVKEQRPKSKIPFFVRFLEQQEALAVQTGVKAGKTLKFPSDTDEWTSTSPPRGHRGPRCGGRRPARWESATLAGTRAARSELTESISRCEMNEQVGSNPSPFFVRFLERREAIVVKTDVRAEPHAEVPLGRRRGLHQLG
jgi:hypothetical protein